MAGDHQLEVEVFPGGPGGGFHVHGEMPAGAKDPYVGRVVFAHPRHVRHDVGVAGDIDRVAFGPDHEPGLGAGIHRTMIGADRRGMDRVDHGDGDLAKTDRAALVEADGRDALGSLQVAHQIVDAGDRNAEVAGDLHGISRVVAVPMRDKDGCGTGNRLFAAALGEHRIAGQPGVDQQHLPGDLDAETGMSQPDDFHENLPICSIED